MPLPEPMFCAQQINIPPELPDLLKQFTKAAIRTQPHDVLQWSAAYFSSLSRGEPLPVKERVEMPVATQKTDTGLTPGLLRVLHRQLAALVLVPVEEVEQRWRDLCLPHDQLLSILELDHQVLNPDDLETAPHDNMITEETEIQDEEFKERMAAKPSEACLTGEDLTDNGLPGYTEGSPAEECPTADETSALDTGSLEETTVHVSAEALPLLRQGPLLVVELQDVAFQQQSDGQRSIAGDQSEGSVETDQSAQKSRGGESSSEEVETETPNADRRGGLRRKARGYKGPPKRRAKLSA